jgi:hypothetical protein
VKSIDSRALVKAPIRSKDAAAAQTTLPPVRRDRENTSEFIAKKREMFLVRALQHPVPCCLQRFVCRSCSVFAFSAVVWRGGEVNLRSTCCAAGANVTRHQAR